MARPMRNCRARMPRLMKLTRPPLPASVRNFIVSGCVLRCRVDRGEEETDEVNAVYETWLGERFGVKGHKFALREGPNIIVEQL